MYTLGFKLIRLIYKHYLTNRAKAVTFRLLFTRIVHENNNFITDDAENLTKQANHQKSFFQFPQFTLFTPLPPARFTGQWSLERIT